MTVVVLVRVTAEQSVVGIGQDLADCHLFQSRCGSEQISA
jgi:hypothetical protein